MGSRKLISFLWDGLKAPTRNFVWSSKKGIDFWGEVIVCLFLLLILQIIYDLSQYIYNMSHHIIIIIHIYIYIYIIVYSKNGTYIYIYSQYRILSKWINIQGLLFSHPFLRCFQSLYCSPTEDVERSCRFYEKDGVPWRLRSTSRNWGKLRSGYDQHSYGKWPFIVSFPIENGDFP